MRGVCVCVCLSALEGVGRKHLFEVFSSSAVIHLLPAYVVDDECMGEIVDSKVMHMLSVSHTRTHWHQTRKHHSKG